jgi:hypothetical protein
MIERILHDKRIGNDYDITIVMDQLERLNSIPSLTTPEPEQSERHKLHSLLARYQLEAHERNIRVLSLDGGGIRGYMPIKIISQLVAEKYLPSTEPFNPRDEKQKILFEKEQSQFTNQFDYFAGTSTGGLIAFCLAMNYSILDLMDIYADYSHYFWRNWLGPYIYSKYNPARIHQKIDDILNKLNLPAEHATLLDIRNKLNPHKIITDDDIQANAPYHGNYLEFVDETINNMPTVENVAHGHSFSNIPREKFTYYCF